jgi:hypothetical protein
MLAPYFNEPLAFEIPSTSDGSSVLADVLMWYLANSGKTDVDGRILNVAEDTVLTRADAAKILAETTDTDAAIAAVKAAGVMIGDPNGNFRPDDTLSGAEVGVISARLLDLDTDSATTKLIAPQWAAGSFTALDEVGASIDEMADVKVVSSKLALDIFTSMKIQSITLAVENLFEEIVAAS